MWHQKWYILLGCQESKTTKLILLDSRARILCLNHQNATHILLLKNGTENTQGKQQVIPNINAYCSAIVDAFRTTLGPRGMNKHIVDNLSEVTISNLFMKLRYVVIPAAKTSVEIAMFNKNSLIKENAYEITYLQMESNIWAPICKIPVHVLVLMYNTNTIIVHNIDVIADNIKYQFFQFLLEFEDFCIGTFFKSMIY